MLGCFSLKLPQFVKKEGADDKGATAIASDGLYAELQGHALTDCVFLSEVPREIGVPDLMRLFGKLGAKEATITPVNDMFGFAQITFSGHENVAKFLVQATHTISESGLTQLAYVCPCLQRKCGSCARTSDHQNNVPNGMPQVTGQTMPAEAEALQLPPVLHAATQPICGTSVVLGTAAPTQQSPNAQVQSTCVPAQNLMPIATSTVPDWRCAHGSIVISPVAPEMLVAPDDCCSACIQWPTVVHASAYVVELLNQRTMQSQRYMRVMLPEGILPALVDLRVDGLEASPYAACVRCVAPCGCESAPSQWSFLHLGSMVPVTTMQMVQPTVLASAPVLSSTPQPCPPPPSTPPSLPLSALVPTVTLPQIPEEALDVVGNANDDVLTLD